MSSTASRRQFLGTSAAALAASALAGCGGGSAEKPNVLWIIAEDFSPDLSCYGNGDLSTPRIDQLAAEGVRYTHATVTGPVCSIARSALMTGMYQTSIGAHHHRSHRTDGYTLPEPVRPFTQLLREAGYHTSNLENTPVGGRGKTDFNYNLEVEPFDGTDWTQREEGQPFYAQINFSETHRAFYHDEERPIDPAAVTLPPYYPDHPVVRQDWSLYLETAQHLDRNVGAVLDRLEEQGLAENTIVFFFGDHGRPMPRGKQFCYEGGMLIPLIVRIPEKYRPADWQVGSANDQLVSHIDITATTLAYAGVPRPDWMEARVFFGPEADAPRDHQICARDRCDETTDRIRAVRTREYKYIRNFMPERPYAQPNHYKDTSYPPLQAMRQLHAAGELGTVPALFLSERKPEEELYDLQADPHEIQNLAGSEAHAAVLEQMRGQLQTWIDETGDMGQKDEDPVPEEYDRRSHAQGWATTDGMFEVAGKTLKAQWIGRDNTTLSKPWVAEPGPFRLRFRARTADAPPKALTWGVVDNVNGKGNRVEIDFPADGAWHEGSAEFEASTWLTVFNLDFGAAQGVFELEWARLERPNGELVREFRFA